MTRMYQRLPAASLSTATWLAHPETALQLQTLGLPHYENEEGGPRLHGLPVRYVEVCSPPGSEGDLILWDPQGYLSVVRAYADAGDIRQNVSMHLWFDYGISALRWTMRVAGGAWVAAPWARYKTTTTISHVVTLAAR